MLLTGLVSAVAALDGKQYNSLRSKLHSLINKVSTRMTVSGFKVDVFVICCWLDLRMVPPFVTALTFCASRVGDVQVS